MWNFLTRLKHNTQWKTRCSTCLCALLPLTVSASPNELPIEVTSNFAEIDGKAGLATHFGHVIMSQGERHIYGEKLVVQRNTGGDIDSLTASGHPARYEGLIREEEPIVHGKARRIHYLPQENLVILEGDAYMQQENDAFHGEHITYNIEKKLIVSEPGSSGRTKIIVEPS